MAKRSEKTQKTAIKEFVTAVFAEDAEQAKEYEALLQSNDIPVEISKQPGESSFAVMVAEEFIDEAHVIVDSQDAYDDFYDLASEEEDDLDFDSDLYDDNEF